MADRHNPSRALVIFKQIGLRTLPITPGNDKKTNLEIHNSENPSFLPIRSQEITIQDKIYVK